MSQLVFDEDAAKQLEALYRIRDAVRRRRLVRDALAAASGERVLDVGCGPGFYCAELISEVGPEGVVVGVDASPQMLSVAENRCAGHANVSFAPRTRCSRTRRRLLGSHTTSQIGNSPI